MASFAVAAIRFAALGGAVAVAASVLYAAVPAPAAASLGTWATVGAALKTANREPVAAVSDAVAVANADRGGRAVIAFHVGDNGKPEAVRLVRHSRSLDFDRRSVRSVIATVCTACAGQDYLVSFDNSF